MKYIIYLALFTFSICNLSSLEPELYNPEGVEFESTFHIENQTIYSIGTDDNYGKEIWKLDKSKDRMVRVTDFEGDIYPIFVDTLDGKLIFVTQKNENNIGSSKPFDMWSMSEDNTITKLFSGYELTYLWSYHPLKFTFKGRWYIILFDSHNLHYNLWTTDGSAEGTYSISDLENIYNVFNIILYEDFALTLGINGRSQNSSRKQVVYKTNFDNVSTKLGEFDRRLHILRDANISIKHSKRFFYDDHYISSQNAIWVVDSNDFKLKKLFEFSSDQDFEDWDYYLKDFDGNYFLKFMEKFSIYDSVERAIYLNKFNNKLISLNDIVGESDLELDILDMDRIGDKFIFRIERGENTEIWATNGLESGTSLIWKVDEGEVDKFVTIDNRGEKIIFEVTKGKNTEIWSTNGLESGTSLVWTINEGRVEKYIKIKEQLYIFTIEDEGNASIISSDGTLEGTNLVWTVIDGEIREYLEFEEKLYFITSDDNGNSSIISSDGTLEGTNTLWSIKNGNIEKFVEIEGILYIVTVNENGNISLIVSDGLAENSRRILELNDEIDEINTTYLFFRYVVYKESVFFTIGVNKFYKFDPKTNILEFVQEIQSSTGYGFSLFGKSLYVHYNNKRLYFNNSKKIFEEIKPLDAKGNENRFERNEFLFKNHLYFFADYYGNNEFKLYRIDNTFQTMSNVEAPSTDELNLYPNPTGDMLNISVKEPTSVTIIDLTGKLVMSIDNYNGEGINTSNLQAGVYNIILDGNTNGGRFVKE